MRQTKAVKQHEVREQFQRLQHCPLGQPFCVLTSDAGREPKPPTLDCIVSRGCASCTMENVKTMAALLTPSTIVHEHILHQGYRNEPHAKVL